MSDDSDSEEYFEEDSEEEIQPLFTISVNQGTKMLPPQSVLQL